MSAMPAHDTCTGVLGALGVLAALYARGEDGPGAHVAVSLAATSTYLQSGEFTDYAGCPVPLEGGTDFRGPAPAHRCHQCADGWIAVAATDTGRVAALHQALGLSGTPGTDPSQIEEAFRGHTVRRALGLLAGRGVPACRVVQPEGALHDPFLADNGFARVVRDPELGRLRAVTGFSRWEGAPAARRPRRSLQAAMGARSLPRPVTTTESRRWWLRYCQADSRRTNI